jgi:hypothetical protein
MLITTTKRRRPDYNAQIRRHPRPIDPYMCPEGGLGGLGDIGIPAVDAVIAQTQTKIDKLVLALQVGAVLSALTAAGNLYLVIRDRRRYGA